MRRRVFLASVGLLVTGSDAGTAAILGPNQILAGRFVQERHLRGFDAPLRTEGNFILVPGRGLIWRAESPFAITTVITAAGLTQDAGGAETLRLSAARLPFLNRLYAMLLGALSGDWRGIEADFLVTRTGTDAAWDARLTPKAPIDAAIPFSAITLSGGRFVDRVRIEKPNGDVDAIGFLDQSVTTGRPRPEDEAALVLPGR